MENTGSNIQRLQETDPCDKVMNLSLANKSFILSIKGALESYPLIKT